MTVTKTDGGMASPVVALTRKSTQDLLDRLKWLEARAEKADDRIAHWMNVRADREEQIGDVRRALLMRGIVDVPR